MNKTFNDLAPIVDQLYNADAKDVIKNKKTTHLVHQWNRQINNNKYEGEQAHALAKLLEKFNIKSSDDLKVSNYIRDCSKVQFFGHTTDRTKVGEVAVHMVNFFNDLASKGLIRAVLAPLTSVELVDGRIILVSYIAIDQPNEAIVQSIYGSMQFQEGTLPPEFI